MPSALSPSHPPTKENVPPMSFLEALEARLQNHVDEQVAAVQAAADHFVAVFRAHAEALARGEITAPPLEHTQKPAEGPPVIVEHPRPEPRQPLHNLPKEVLDEVGDMFGVMITDHAAAAANMRV